jgi:mono/diheme cytochrome c family protein
MYETSARILLISAMLVAACGTAAAAQTPASAEPDGAALYRQNCRSCHGARGAAPERMRSVYPSLKNLADPAFLARVSADSIVAILRHGQGKDMKSFSDRLSPAEMQAVARYVKEFGASVPAGP